ncbi:hypothetical protein ABZ234_02305 [Nocardiopsis sp. NPDC006198]
MVLAEEDVQRPLSEAVDKALSSLGQPTEKADVYLKAGRKVARIERSKQ